MKDELLRMEAEVRVIISRVLCWFTHRRHWEWYGYGDWRIQRCGKCGDKWAVLAHQVKGKRGEP